MTALDWVFRNRETGRVTIVQPPNLSLGAFLVASVARRVLDPHGWPRTLLVVVAASALVWWAVDEISRGVNPWRRFLGATVLLAAAVGLLVR
ncbi:MAG: conserved rane protein of unknown function [Acidimicrobiales bacterium]|nr:conserved rane protein of unknown function [Acidimicrobiales bacterium]